MRSQYTRQARAWLERHPDLDNDEMRLDAERRARRDAEQDGDGGRVDKGDIRRALRRQGEIV